MDIRAILAVTILTLPLTLCLPTRGMDEHLDPGRITWWQTTWAARPIELTKANSGSTVDFTFKFTPSTSIAKGCVEVYFPAGIVPPSAQTGNMYSNCDPAVQNDVYFALIAGVDASFSVNSVTLPATGGYGPFKIVTRRSEMGQIVDINSNFGSIFVTPALSGTAGTLTVSSSSGNDVEVSSLTDLIFDFELTVDFWKNDMFVIDIADQWVMNSTPVCESQAINSGYENQLVSRSNTHILECAADRAKGLLYIYGQSSDIDISADAPSNTNILILKLKVTGFTAPPADYEGTEYNWRIEIWRYSVRSAVYAYAGTGPNTTPGNIEVASWVSTNGHNADQLATGVRLYMTATIGLVHPIPVGGQVLVSYSGVEVFTPFQQYDADFTTGTVGTNAFCDVEWLGFSTTCSVSNANVVTVTFSQAVPESFTFKLTNLVYFSTSQGSITVTSYYTNSITDKIIDTMGSTFFQKSTNSNWSLLTAFKLTFSDSAAANDTTDTGGNTAAKYMYIDLNIDGSTKDATASSTSFSLDLPLNTSGLADDEVYIYGGTGQFRCSYHRINSYVSNLTPVDVTANTPNPWTYGPDNTAPSTQNAVVTDNNVSLTFDFNTYIGAIIGCYNHNGVAIQNLQLPRVATNKKTRYEARLVVTLNNTNFVRFQVLTFTAAAPTTSGTRLCQKPVLFTFTPRFTVDTTISNRQYYLNLSFSSFGAGKEDLESGLSNGDVYPFASKSNFVNNAAFTLASSFTLQLTNQPTYTEGTAYEFFTSLGSVLSYNLELYYTLPSSDSSVKYVLMSSTAASISAEDAGTDSNNPTVTQSFMSATPTSVTTQAVTITSAQAYYTAQFPRGFTFNNLAYLRVNGISAYPTYVIQSNNANFAFPALVGQITAGAASGAIVASGVIPSQYAQTGVNIITGDNNGNCGDFDTTFNVGSGEITDYQFSPGTVEARSPNSYSTTFKVKFSTVHGIPLGGAINVQISGQWIITATSCTTEGLEPLTENGTISCVLSSNVWVITNFKKVDGIKSITLSWANTVPPSSTSSSVAPHIQSLYTSYNSKIIDQLQSIPSNSCQITQPVSHGRSHILESRTYPPNALQTNVDLYLKFTLDHDLPVGATITLTNGMGNWSEGTFTNDYIFFSKQYSAYNVNISELTLTLAEPIKASEDVLELYLERMVTNAAVGTSGTYKFKTMYQGIVIDQDITSNLTSDHLISVQPEITKIIDTQNSNFAVSATNAGDTADYVFTVRTDAAVVKGDEFWVRFPKEFDPYLGKAYKKYQYSEDDTYYLDCSSEILGDVECQVDHWTLYITNIQQQVQSSTTIAVTIYKIKNPPITSPGTTGNFIIYHVDSTGNGKAVQTASTGVTTTALAGNLYGKSFTVDNHNLFSIGSYTIQFQAFQEVDSDDDIEVTLPDEYQLGLNTDDALDCKLRYVDYTVDTNFQDFPSAQTCSKQIQKIIAVQNDGQAFTFSNNSIGSFSFDILTSPEFGSQRPKVVGYSWDFEASDSSAFPIYDYWTHQFELAFRDTVNKVYTARSYLNVNNLYLGFNKRSRSFTINNNQRIDIRAGTQSEPIKIATTGGEPLASLSVKLNISVNQYTPGDFTISSPEFFTLQQGEKDITFVISTPITQERGNYYLNWELEQDYEEHIKDKQYDPPIKTLIEVNTVDKYEFEVENIRPLAVGRKSRPFRVHIDRSPHTDVSLKIAVAEQDITDLVISPNVLTFSPGLYDRYFTISVPEDYDMEGKTQLNLTFTAEGTDVAAYEVPDDHKFTITEATISHAGKVKEIKESNVGRTHATIKATSDSDGIIYYYAGSYGTDPPTSTAIIDLVGDIFLLEENGDQAEEISDEPIEVEPSDEDLNNGRVEPWTHFQRRLYADHRQQVFYGAVVANANEEVLLAELEQLFADTLYFVWAVVNNYSNSLSEPVVHQFRTLAISPAVIFTIKFNKQVSETVLDLLKENTASVMGININRFMNGERVLSRRLQSDITSFNWVIPPNRGVENPTPLEIATLTTEQKDTLSELIRTVVLVSSPATYIVREYTADEYVVPQWDSGYEPKAETVDTNSVIMSMKTDVGGECCCMATQGLDNYVNHWQLLLGLDENNQEAQFAQCVNYPDATVPAKVTISGLAESTAYLISCTCYNGYPVWPVSVQYGEQGNYIAQINIETTSSTINEDDDFAGRLSLALLFILLLGAQQL